MRKRIIPIFMLCFAIFIGSTFVYAADSDYQISRQMVTGNGTNIYISWKNPLVSTINSIKVYDVTTANATQITCTPVTTSGGLNRIEHTGVTSGAIYKYKIEMNFTDHDPIIYHMYGTTSGENEYTAPANWMRGTVNKNQQFSTVVENDENTALKMVSTQSSWSEGDLRVIQNVSFTANTKYLVKFDYKGYVKDMYVQLGNKNTAGTKLTATKDSWTTQSYELTPTGGNAQFFFNVAASAGVDFMIDNVSIQAWDAATETYGENLIKNGDFESGGNSCSAVTDVVAEAGNRQLTLSWNNPTETTFMHTRVYIKLGGELFFKANVPGTEESFLLNDLINGQNYELVVKAVDKYGRETLGNSVIAVPTEPAYELGELNFGADGQVETGTQTCSIMVKNNKLTEGYNIQILVVAYDEDGAIANTFSSGPQNIAIGTEPMPVICNAEITSEHSKVQVYVWSSLADMDILIPYKEYSVNN